MTDLNTKAENYAAEKTNDLIAKAIAQAYADGYRDGFKDCEAERPVILNDSDSEYVDLGLTSETLWSSDYERENDRTIYTSFEKAIQLSIPTKEQVQELFEYCLLEETGGKTTSHRFVCIGPNGKSVTFYFTGYLIPHPIDSKRDSYWHTWFWVKGQNNSFEKQAAHIMLEKGDTFKKIEQFTQDCYFLSDS